MSDQIIPNFASVTEHGDPRNKQCSLYNESPDLIRIDAVIEKEGSKISAQRSEGNDIIGSSFTSIRPGN
jgi:hypothetical protein